MLPNVFIVEKAELHYCHQNRKGKLDTLYSFFNSYECAMNNVETEYTLYVNQ